MIAYVCKYTPTLIFEAFDKKPFKIEPNIAKFQKADELFYINMCAYSRAVLETLIEKDITEVVLVNCCDSIRRLYDVLKKQKKFKFVYLIDLPHKLNKSSKKLFKNEIIKFIEEYEGYSQKKFDLNKVFKVLEDKSDVEIKFNHDNIILAGARVNNEVLNMINLKGFEAINLSCTGNEIFYSNINDKDKFIDLYVDELLKMIPCMRMVNVKERESYLKEISTNTKGIIYHGIKFCDYYSHEFMKIKETLNLPILKIESDYSKQGEGQMKTRVEAFIEGIKSKTIKPKEIEISKGYYVGIDSGSTSTNVVVLNENREIVSYAVVRTSSKSINGANEAMNEALKKIGLSRNNIVKVVSTGYGRVSIPFADESITEITCHAKGAFYINNNVRTIIDIGGQDSKAIKLDERGNVIDFVMNDKCAAGTGRFLEMMASVLEIQLEEMGELALNNKEELVISSMCSVFAESEVISLIAQNKEKSDIVYGLCDAIASRTIAMSNRIKGNDLFMMTGGVAKNKGVVKCIENRLNQKIFIPDEPEIIGALGAAILASGF